MALVPLLFSFKGRIPRQPFWLFTFVMAAIILLPALFFFGIGTNTANSYVNIMSVVFLWPVLAVQAKRWHDRNKTAWWLLINLLPVVGFIWALIDNGFLQGTRGPNRFGPDPLDNPHNSNWQRPPG